MRERLHIDKYVDGILNGNRIILSQAITLIESSKKEDISLAQNLIKKITPYTGNSKRLGITGVPGVGKSTFIESFGNLLITKGNKVAILTIDPSSQKTSGSILGDKTRMDTLSVNPDAYIRPSPSSNSLGGVANKTRETILLCEAAGFNIIIIETVGVGQSEVAVKNMTDMFILLMLAGAGDELQGIKRGIMEMADLIVITKSDGNNIVNAKNAKIEYQNAVHLFLANESNWTTPVTTCSATKNKGIETIWRQCEEFFNFINNNNYFSLNRLNQSKHWFKELLEQRILSTFYNNRNIKNILPEIENQITNKSKSIGELVDNTIKVYSKKNNV